MSRSDLIEAIADLAVLMSASPENHALAAKAFTLLTESLAELGTLAAPVPHRPRREQMIHRLVLLQQQMHGRGPLAIAERLGVGKSYYYELRAEALREGLLHE